MHHYHHRAFYIGILSVVLIVVGLVALNFPVFIDAYDQWGWQIKCGTGYGSDLTQAAEAIGGNYVDQCGTALMLRRIWAIPMVVIGAICSWVFFSWRPPCGAANRCSEKTKARDVASAA